MRCAPPIWPAARAELAADRRRAGRRPLRGRARPGRDGADLHRRPLPAGADAIVLQENASADGRSRPARGPRRARHLSSAPPASTSGAASSRCRPGARLTARDLGFAAALNQAWLPVRRQPRIALLATGDELVMPGQPLAPTPDRQLQQHGARRVGDGLGRRWPRISASSPDEPAALAAVGRALAGVDLLVTLGGASVGEHDLVRARARRARPRARFLADRDAAGQAADVRPDPRRADARPARQSGLDRGLRDAVRARGDLRALLGLDPAPPEVPARARRSLWAPTTAARTICARAPTWGAGRPPRWRIRRRCRTARCSRPSRAPTCLIKRPPFAPAMPAGTPVPVLPARAEPDRRLSAAGSVHDDALAR